MRPTDDERCALIVELAIRHSLRSKGIALPPIAAPIDYKKRVASRPVEDTDNSGVAA